MGRVFERISEQVVYLTAKSQSSQRKTQKMKKTSFACAGTCLRGSNMLVAYRQGEFHHLLAVRQDLLSKKIIPLRPLRLCGEQVINLTAKLAILQKVYSSYHK